MSTHAGTVGVSGRSALFTVWTVTVSVLAAAALILSGLALNVAARSDRSATVDGGGTVEAASIGSPLWDAGKLEAMEVRMDLAEAARTQGTSTLWDAGKLEAMDARMDLAEAAWAKGPDAP
jgi:hypothetical protein